MIRQAISCDICAAEKRQTNHWFVAYEQGGELRVSGWTSRHRLRPDSKHLCGQTCLHKLVDEFMAKCIARRAQRNDEAAEAEVEPRVLADTSLTTAAAQVAAATRIAAAARGCRGIGRSRIVGATDHAARARLVRAASAQAGLSSPAGDRDHAVAATAK